MELINSNNKKIVSVFFTAGYPRLGLICQTCNMLEKAGVNMIEIGIPCSDPLADGPVIQESSLVALENGMTLEILFKELSELRKKVKIPILLMGYYNQVLQYGVKEFIRESKKCGVNGFIIPDQPVESVFGELCKQHTLANVRLVCPSTSNERIKMLDALSTGFLYVVSSSATTGGSAVNVPGYFARLKALGLKNKLITGFGIKDAASFESATEFTNGAIVGSAFVRFISVEENLDQEKIIEFVKSIKPAITEQQKMYV